MYVWPDCRKGSLLRPTNRRRQVVRRSRPNTTGPRVSLVRKTNGILLSRLSSAP